MKGFVPTPVTTTNLIFDSDLIVPAGRKITVDHIAETTGAHNVVMDNILAAAATLKADHIAELTGAHDVVVDSHLRIDSNWLETDFISERIPGAGVSIAPGVVYFDHVGEYTGAHGIVANHALAAAVTLKTDHIEELAGGHNIVCSHNLDAPKLYTDHLAEKTGAHGVVFDNVANVTAGITPTKGAIVNVIGGYQAAALTDSVNYYFGAAIDAAAWNTTATSQRLYITKAGTINVATFHMKAATAGTNENISVYIRLNDTSDTLVQTVGTASNSRVFTNTGLSIAVAVGDYIEVKMVCPAWATNPANVNFGGSVYIV